MIFSAIASGLAWVGGFLGAAAGLSFSAAVTFGTYFGTIGAAVVAIGINRLLSPKLNIPTSEVQAVLNQTDSPRRVYVGRNLVGGIRAFYHTDSGCLYQLVVVNHGEITGFKELWIDSEKATIDAVGNVTSTDKKGYVRVATRKGDWFGGDYAELSSTFGGTWDSSHRLERQATFLAMSYAPKPENFSKVFPKSYNTVFQWVIEGAKLYDHRSGATSYGTNAALVIAFYLTHPDGYRLDHPLEYGGGR